MSTTTKKTRPLNLKSRDVREKLAKKRIKELENEMSVLKKYEKKSPLRNLRDFKIHMLKLYDYALGLNIRYLRVLYPTISVAVKIRYEMHLEGKEIRRLKLVEAKRQDIRDLVAAGIDEYDYSTVEMRRNGDMYIKIIWKVGIITNILIEKNDILKPVPKCFIGTLDRKGSQVIHNTTWGFDNAIVQVKKITETAFQS